MSDEQKTTLELNGDKIVSKNGSDFWEISVNDLELVGEFTDSNGPYIDDYFFVFVVAPKHEHYITTFYAEGRDDFLNALSKYLDYELKCELCNSVDFNSSIMWPDELKRKKLYRFEPVKSGSLWNRFLHWLSPQFHLKFSDDVCDYLNISRQ